MEMNDRLTCQCCTYIHMRSYCLSCSSCSLPSRIPNQCNTIGVNSRCCCVSTRNGSGTGDLSSFHNIDHVSSSGLESGSVSVNLNLTAVPLHHATSASISKYRMPEYYSQMNCPCRTLPSTEFIYSATAAELLPYPLSHYPDEYSGNLPSYQ